MPVTSYSTTPASNSSAAPNGAPEGMAPSGVNDTIRQIMTDIAVEAQTNAVKVLSGVAGVDTITASMSPALTAYVSKMYVIFTPAGTNATTTSTLNINGLGAKTIKKSNAVALDAGDLVAAAPAFCIYDGTNFVLQNPQLVGTPNTSAREMGFKGMPLNDQSAGSYAILLKDMGCYINCGSGFTYTFPANASIPCPTGSIVLFYNSGGASCTITVGGTDLMGLAGTALNGARTLASGGMATFLKTTPTVWVGSGAGLS